MYVKLFSRMLKSSVMDEDVQTRWAWVVMLLLSDQDGVVYGTVAALARSANVAEPDFAAALERLMAPDPSSTSQVEEGRRIKPLSPNRWLIVNYEAYRNLQDSEHERANAAGRQRRHREKERAGGDVTPVTPVTDRNVRNAVTRDSPVTVVSDCNTCNAPCERSANAERQRRHREKAKALRNVTPCHAPSPQAEAEAEAKENRAAVAAPAREGGDGNGSHVTLNRETWRLEGVTDEDRTRLQAEFPAVDLEALLVDVGEYARIEKSYRGIGNWLRAVRARARDLQAKAPKPAGGHIPVPSSDATPPEPLPDLTPTSANWPRVLQVLATRVPEEAMAEWLAPLRYVGDRGESLELVAKDDWDADWVRHNFREVLADAVRDVCGRARPVRVVAAGGAA